MTGGVSQNTINITYRQYISVIEIYKKQAANSLLASWNELIDAIFSIPHRVAVFL